MRKASLPALLLGLFLGPLLITFSTQEVVIAAPTKPEASKSKKVEEFDDLLVQGKYHFGDESVVTVEEDKVLDSLLGMRKDFKDRVKQSASRN